jgi:hypothetical protein
VKPRPRSRRSPSAWAGSAAAPATASIYNQYNALGLNNNNPSAGILGFDYSVRDPEAMTLFKFRGANLLDDSRELGLSLTEPGEWRLKASYGELVHTSPYTINSGVVGAGSTAPQVVYLPGGVGSGYNTQLQTKRSNVGLGFSKWIDNALQIRGGCQDREAGWDATLRHRHELPVAGGPGLSGHHGHRGGLGHADGAAGGQLEHEPDRRPGELLDGQAAAERGLLRLVLPEQQPDAQPVGSGQSEQSAGDALLPLSAGLQPLLNLPVAQEPDNRFNQLSLTGTYDLAEKTKASFKLSYANTTQNQNFAASGLSGAPAGVTSLGGNVNSTLAWLGITSRPIPKLTLQADVRYADRDDKTPDRALRPGGLFGLHQPAAAGAEGLGQAAGDLPVLQGVPRHDRGRLRRHRPGHLHAHEPSWGRQCAASGHG